MLWLWRREKAAARAPPGGEAMKKSNPVAARVPTVLSGGADVVVVVVDVDVVVEVVVVASLCPVVVD